MSNIEFPLRIEEIKRFLPHRAPFLLVDRVLDIKCEIGKPQYSYSDMVGVKVIAQKNVSYNEPFFVGHFPEFAILPGVYITEIMAQTASFCIYPIVYNRLEEFSKTFKCILIGLDGVKFRKPVVPGDILRIESEVQKCRGKIWSFACSAFVDDQKVAEASILAHMDSDVQFKK